MKKSFRNLVLSLLLAAGAAGFAACEGNTGPAGEAGPSGAAGAPGPKGETGETGKTADEIPLKYAFLESWGKADGTAACSDDILTKTQAFPGPATLAKVDTKGGPVMGQETPTIPVGSSEGDCSDKVFGANPFMFVQKLGARSDVAKKTRMGTTEVLGNPTLTETTNLFFEGEVKVTFKAGAAEILDRELLFTRCGNGKRPSGNVITGEYRIIGTDESEHLLERGTDGILKPKNGTTERYRADKSTVRICIRFDSVPGTVKCYVSEWAHNRDPGTELRENSGPPFAGDRIAVYKNGQLTLAAPMPVNNGLPGKGGATSFPYGGTVSGNLLSAAKLCNFFAGGVNKCESPKVPNSNGDGTCVAP